MRDSSDVPEPASNKTTAPSDEHPPWTIRDFPPDSRAAAIAAAKKDRVRVAAWLDAAIREKIQAARRLPAVIPASDPPSIDDLAKLSAIVSETARAGGKSVPSYMRGLIYRHVQARLGAHPLPLVVAVGPGRLGEVQAAPDAGQEAHDEAGRPD